MNRLLQIAEEFYFLLREKTKNRDRVNEWKLVAMVLDRLFLICFVLLWICLASTILTRNGPYEDDENYLKVIG